MIKSGVCSITFGERNPAEIISLVKTAGIEAIEWASDPHVKPGDVETAKEVRAMCDAAGVEISSYGSYYRLGMNHDIAPYFESAKALGVNQMRIWAGPASSAYTTEAGREFLVREAQEISRKAAEYGICISTECHSGTLTDCPESLLSFMREVGEANFCSYWQALLHITEEKQLPFLKQLYSTGKLTNIHVYRFDDALFHKKQIRLSEGYDEWIERLEILRGDEKLRYAMIEFVCDGKDETFIEDAKVLREILEKVN